MSTPTQASTIWTHSCFVVILVMVALLAPGVPAAAADPAVLNGKVVDFAGNAIKKAAVVLTSADDPSLRLTATSDRIGRFEIAVEDASLSYQAHFERNGFVGMTATIELVAGETNEHTFTMLTHQEIVEGKDEILAQRETPAEFTALGLYNDGVTALTDGDLDTARARFEAALEHNDSMLQALSALCLVTMKQQDWTAAVEYAGRTLAVEPTDIRALFAAYRANKKLGDEVAAAAEALRSTGTNHDVAGQIFNEGVDRYREHRIPDAIALFEEAAGLDPTMVNVQIALAGLYLDQGAFDQALAASDRALALDPGNATALKYQFEACLRSGSDRLPGAIEALGAVDPAYVSQAINELAFGLFKQNQNDQARALVEQLLALDPADARANYLMGLLLVNAGDNEAARRHLQAFVDAAPEDPDAAAARAMMDAIR